MRRAYRDGLCRTHDPELAAKRRAARGPTAEQKRLAEIELERLRVAELERDAARLDKLQRLSERRKCGWMLDDRIGIPKLKHWSQSPPFKTIREAIDAMVEREG